MALERREHGDAMSDTISTTEAAKMLCVCNGNYVARLLRQGKLEGEKIDTPRGSVWRVYRDSVLAYSENRPTIGRPTQKNGKEANRYIGDWNVTVISKLEESE